MRREGLTTMDYMEQLSWLLFLKSFEGAAKPRAIFHLLRLCLKPEE